MTTFRLLQASDLHLAVKPYQYGLPGSWRDAVRFRRSPRDVSSHDPDVQTALAAFAASVAPDEIDYDVLILSGDLAITGRSQDLRAARGFVQTPAASGGLVAPGKPCLNGDPQTVGLIPGNHDRFGPASGLYHPGNRNFDILFQSYWQAGLGGVQQLWEQLWNFRASRTSTCLIGSWSSWGWSGSPSAPRRSPATATGWGRSSST